MILLSDNFLATKWPGYFYNVDENRIYTIKSGTLRPITPKKAFRNHPRSFVISNRGIRKAIPVEWLKFNYKRVTLTDNYYPYIER